MLELSNLLAREIPQPYSVVLSTCSKVSPIRSKGDTKESGIWVSCPLLRFTGDKIMKPNLAICADLDNPLAIWAKASIVCIAAIA
jgi:hypothetical protein